MMYRAIVTVLVSTVLSLSISTAYAADDESLEGGKLNPEKNLPLAELRRFSEVFDRIKQAYVEPVSDAELLEDAVRGMLTGLDPHSSYLSADDYSELQIQTSGQFGGVGIEISQEDGMIRVITPIDGTPAMEAGIKPGDLIIKIDDVIIRSIGLDQAIAMMRGKPGTLIVLTIVRDDADKPIEISLKRDIIRVTSVRSRYVDDGIGYLRISQFQHHTARDLDKALKQMQQQGALTGLVLDLRNNPGGVLRGAVDVSDAFISEGVIVSTKGRLASSQMSFEATAEMSIADIPMVVLINGGSASASEIVAGALQDKNRAIIMGTTSFGKGSVQTVLQLSEKRAMKLTTARYYTPSGRSIQAKGIEPDILVEQQQVKAKKSSRTVKEQDLSGHLQNSEKGSLKIRKTDLIETDFQLYEAVNLLKGLVIVRQSTN
ncbi:MAG: S41 family peptidase [Pseudomonadales bacterium]|nr:S41 family peptidase [Pseudomonadales bacterium]NRA17217.1 S41 family peptidase [Oceanospirillaceae bacterium]